MLLSFVQMSASKALRISRATALIHTIKQSLIFRLTTILEEGPEELQVSIYLEGSEQEASQMGGVPFLKHYDCGIIYQLPL